MYTKSLCSPIISFQIAATIATIILTFFIIYISCRVYVEDDKFIWMHQLAIAISTLVGTSFQKSDLTNANFTNAELKTVNLSAAKIDYWNTSYQY